MSISDAEAKAIIALCGGGTPPVGAFAETVPRRLAASVTTLTATTQTLFLFAIILPPCLVTNITFVAGTTAEATGSHLWYALYTAQLSLLAQTADDTGAASFAASAALTKALQTAQRIDGGLYYLGFMCQATQAPTLLSNVGFTSVNGIAPIVAGTSTAALGATAPNPAAALSAIANSAYAYVS